jgi:iron complex outermembrane receptor protein
MVGLRFDRESGETAFTIEAGAYDIDIEQVPLDRDLTGYHLLGRWAKQPEQGSSFNLQAYYDRTNREQPGSIIDKLDTWDVEFQHGFQPLAHHEFLWGAGYRYQWDMVTNLGPGFAFIPDDRAIRTAHAFAEDGIRLTDAWKLELGLKAESNEYTDLEWLPTIRLSVKPAAKHLLWSAVSRAVRAPARIEKDFFSPAAPPHVVLDGGPDFVSEVSNVAEVGYRGQAGNDMSVSLTAFIHEHDELRSLEPTADGPQWQNKIHGTTRGLEGWLRWRPVPRWELAAGGVVQDIRLALDADSNDLGGLVALGNDPDFWYQIHSSLDVTEAIEFSADFRRVGALPNPYVPAYNAADARIGWWVKPNVSLSLTGRNLLERSHPEWGVAPVRAEVARSLFLSLGWRSK